MRWVRLPCGFPGKTSCKSVLPCCSGVCRLNAETASGFAVGIAATRPESDATSSELSSSRTTMRGIVSSPWIVVKMPRVGPGFAPVTTWSPRRRSAPDASFATCSRTYSRPALIFLASKCVTLAVSQGISQPAKPINSQRDAVTNFGSTCLRKSVFISAFQLIGSLSAPFCTMNLASSFISFTNALSKVMS